MSVSQPAAVPPHSNRPLVPSPTPVAPPPPAKRKSIFSSFSLSARPSPAASPTLRASSTPQSVSPAAHSQPGPAHAAAAPAPAALSLGTPALSPPASTPTPSTPPLPAASAGQLPHSHSAPSAAASRGAVNVSAAFPQAMQHFQQQHLSYLHYQQQQQMHMQHHHQQAVAAARHPSQPHSHPPSQPYPSQPYPQAGVYQQLASHSHAPHQQQALAAHPPHMLVHLPAAAAAPSPAHVVGQPVQQPSSVHYPQQPSLPAAAAALSLALHSAVSPAISAAPLGLVLLGHPNREVRAEPPPHLPPPAQPQPQPAAALPHVQHQPGPSPRLQPHPAPAASPSPPLPPAASPAAHPPQPPTPAPSSSSAQPPMETNGPPPPKPALAGNPTSFFAQLILAPPKPPPTANQPSNGSSSGDDTLKRLRHGLEAVKVREDERVKREGKRREEREERLKRTERVEYELNEKKRAAAYKKQKDEDKPGGGGGGGGIGGKSVKKMLGKMADKQTEKEIERVRVKKAEMVSERDDEKRKDKVRDMDRDERVLLMTAGVATDELAGVSVDSTHLPLVLPSLLSGLACHAHDAQTVGRVLHYLYTMYLTAALNVPSSLPSSTAPSPLKPLNTAMYENGAVGLLVGCLFDHSENAPIQQDALLLLYCLCSDKSYAETCVNNGGINAIAIALTNHPTLPLLLGVGVALLTRLATQLPQYVLLMLQSDTLPLLLSTLAAHPNNELLAYHALGSFALLAASSTEHRVLLGESGVVEAVIMAMYTFPASLLLQREALHALAALCNEQIENGRKVYRNSGIQASMLTVSKHASDDVEVLQSALRLLMELEWQQLVTQKALEAVDGLAVLLTAAAAHITLLDVQKQLMATIAVTCEHSVELQSKAIARGVVDHLLTLSKQFSYTYGTEQLWAAMCQCIRHLSSADVNKPLLSTAVLVSLLFSALKLHVTSDSVALQAVASLAHLTDHSDDTVRRTLVSQVGDGGMVGVLHVMECHSAVRAVIEQCVVVLYNLLRNHVDYQRQLIQADGIPSLLTACKDHSSSEIVCRHVLAVFSLLSDSMDEKELFLRMHGDSINQILIAMRNHPSSLRLQCYALLTLRNLTNKFDCGPTKSGEIIDVTLVKMKAFPLSASIQQWASECLWNLALTDSTNKRKMQAGEGIALVLAARRMHSGVFDVTHATNGLLDVLECSIAEEGKEEKSWEQMQEEGLQHEADKLIAQMTAAADNVDVQLHGMDRLCALAAASSSIHPLLLAHLDVLFSALRSHPDTELIQLAGLNILGRLSTTATAVAAVTEHGGIAAALTAMSPMPSSSLLLENAVSLLRLLASESTNCYLIGRTGGLELVLEGMAAFQQLVSVQEHSVRCVAVLLARDENKQRLMAAGGLDILAAALQACGGRSVVAAETVLSSVDALLRWGGAGVMTVNTYWALVHTAHAFPWHAVLQQQCAIILPYFHHLSTQPPQANSTVTAMVQSDVAGPPGGAAYAAATQLTPRGAAGLDAAKMGGQENERMQRTAPEQREAMDKQLLAEVGAEDDDEEAQDDEEDEQYEEGEDEEDEDEDEEEVEEEEDEEEEDGDDQQDQDEDVDDVNDVKEGEERTPVTASPAAEPEEEVKEETDEKVDTTEDDEKKTVVPQREQNEQPLHPSEAAGQQPDEVSSEWDEVEMQVDEAELAVESGDDGRQPVEPADDQHQRCDVAHEQQQAADEGDRAPVASEDEVPASEWMPKVDQGEPHIADEHRNDS